MGQRRMYLCMNNSTAQLANEMARSGGNVRATMKQLYNELLRSFISRPM